MYTTVIIYDKNPCIYVNVESLNVVSTTLNPEVSSSSTIILVCIAVGIVALILGILIVVIILIAFNYYRFRGKCESYMIVVNYGN